MTLPSQGASYFEVRATLDKLEEDLKKARELAAKEGEASGEEMAKSFSERMGTVGDRLTKTLTPAAAAVAGMAGMIASEWNEGVTTIRKETGKTGDALDDLIESARNVAGDDVTTGFAEVSATVAELTKRMELTGPAAEALTKQIVLLAELTDGDASESVAGIVDLFKVWEVETADQTGLLDLLYKASQNSGASVETIISTLASGAGPLKNFNFTLDESVALIASIEKEGGNAPKIISALQLAFVKLSQTSEDPAAALEHLADRIRGAGSSAEATAIAAKALGTRAGPALASAIRAGRFEVEDFLGVLNSSGETLENASAATRTFSDRVAMLRNKVTETVGPIANQAAVIATIAAGAGPAITGLTKLGVSVEAIPWIAFAYGASEAAKSLYELADEGLESRLKSLGDTLRDRIGGLAWLPGLKETKEEAEGAAEGIEKLEDPLVTAARTTQLLTLEQESLGKTTERASKKLMNFAGMTRKSFEDWRKGTVDSLGSVDDKLEDLAKHSKVTADQILKAFEKQLNAQRNYGRNFAEVVERAGTEGDGLLVHLQEMGLGGASVVAALAKANKEKFEDIITAWERGERSADWISDVIGRHLEKIGAGADHARDDVAGLDRGLRALASINLQGIAAKLQTLDLSVPTAPSSGGHYGGGDDAGSPSSGKDPNVNERQIVVQNRYDVKLDGRTLERNMGRRKILIEGD